jgi:hypothetical protein
MTAAAASPSTAAAAATREREEQETTEQMFSSMHVGVPVSCCFVPQNSELLITNVCCAPDGLVASQAETKALPCQRDDDSQGGERDIQIPYLPEVCYDILLIVGLVQVKCQ